MVHISVCGHCLLSEELIEIVMEGGMRLLGEGSPLLHHLLPVVDENLREVLIEKTKNQDRHFPQSFLGSLESFLLQALSTVRLYPLFFFDSR